MTGSLLAFCTGQTVQIWDPVASSSVHGKETEQSHVVIKKDGKQRAVRWNQNSKVLASAGEKGTLLLSYSDGRQMGLLPQSSSDADTPSTSESVNTLCFSKGSKFVAAACTHGRILVWDLKRQVYLRAQ